MECDEKWKWAPFALPNERRGRGAAGDRREIGGSDSRSMRVPSTLVAQVTRISVIYSSRTASRCKLVTDTLVAGKGLFLTRAPPPPPDDPMLFPRESSVARRSSVRRSASLLTGFSPTVICKIKIIDILTAPIWMDRRKRACTAPGLDLKLSSSKPFPTLASFSSLFVVTFCCGGSSGGLGPGSHWGPDMC